ncbi:MAG: hypothetical protein JO199_02325 [Candidatus Eremiobacteraeota bacterium]|nr:hypothetical protein [Candidatus Eremiobacteraeota bacterium]
MRAGFAAAAALLALLCAFGRSSAQEASPALSSTPPSIDAFYSNAVQAMCNLPQPPYLSYTMEGQGEGLWIDLKVIDHLVWLNMATMQNSMPTMTRWWRLRHRTEDYASEIVTENGSRLVSMRSFFDPTWYGAFHALRDGMLNYQKPEAPVSASATPTPGPSAPEDLRTIAVVEVIGSAIYRVEDRGPMQCDNGDPGHSVHLISKDNNPRHQLTDVTVDLNNMRFCTIRFNDSEHGFTGSVEQHYSTVGGYWLQTDGVVETSYRTFGIRTGHGLWHYRLGGMTFPQTIAAEAFTLPPYQ